MANGSLSPVARQQFTDINGNPLPGALLYSFLTGTSTPDPLYTDAALAVPHPNPAVADSGGFLTLYMSPAASQKWVLKNAAGVTQWTVDPVSHNMASLVSGTFLASSRGSAGAPAFSFSVDTDTGVFSSAANTLDISTSGAQRVRFHPTGGVSIGGTTDPGALNLRVEGAITLIGSAVAPANTLENRSGSLYFNNVALATGSSVSGTSGKIAKFTGSSTIGDSIASESGTTITVAGTLVATLHSGSGASLTALPAGQLNGTITSATQDLITRLGTIVAGIWNAGAVTSTGNITTSAGSVIVPTSGFVLLDGGGDTYLHESSANVIEAVVGGGIGMRLSSSGVHVGGGNITDAVATPTIASGFGTTGATIAGKCYAFVVTIGTGLPSSGIVNFNQTFTNAPICTVSGTGQIVAGTLNVTSSTTQVTITTSGNWAGGNLLYVLVRGY